MRLVRAVRGPASPSLAPDGDCSQPGNGMTLAPFMWTEPPSLERSGEMHRPTPAHPGDRRHEGDSRLLRRRHSSHHRTPLPPLRSSFKFPQGSTCSAPVSTHAAWHPALAPAPPPPAPARRTALFSSLCGQGPVSGGQVWHLSVLLSCCGCMVFTACGLWSRLQSAMPPRGSQQAVEPRGQPATPHRRSPAAAAAQCRLWPKAAPRPRRAPSPSAYSSVTRWRRWRSSLESMCTCSGEASTM